MDVYNLVNSDLKEMVFLPGERNEKINKLSTQERNLQKFKWGKWNLTVEKLQLWRTRLIQEWNRVNQEKKKKNKKLNLIKGPRRKILVAVLCEE